jgi:hypothetical protein
LATSGSLRKAEDFLADLAPNFPQDGSCAEHLRNGLCLLSRTNMPIATESFLLLAALYIALTDSDDVPLDEIPERVHAWALGLPEGSNLVAVIDTIIACIEQDLPPAATLSHLFMLPEFTRTVAPEDRRWHSAPGTDLVPLALELGYAQIDTRASRTYRLTPGNSAIMKSILKGPSNPDGALGDEDTYDMLAKLFELIDLHPAWAAAFLEENSPLPRLDGTFTDKAGERDWHAAIDRYLRSHPDVQPPDANSELSKLRWYDGLSVLNQALADEAFARELVGLMAGSPADEDYGLIGVREVVHGFERQASDALADDPGFEDRALSLALSWGGQALHDRMVDYCDSLDETADEVLLLVLAGAYVAVTRDHHTDQSTEDCSNP